MNDKAAPAAREPTPPQSLGKSPAANQENGNIDDQHRQEDCDFRPPPPPGWLRLRWGSRATNETIFLSIVEESKYDPVKAKKHTGPEIKLKVPAARILPSTDMICRPPPAPRFHQLIINIRPKLFGHDDCHRDRARQQEPPYPPKIRRTQHLTHDIDKGQVQEVRAKAKRLS